MLCICRMLCWCRMLYVVNASAQFAKAVFAIELASVPWFERLVGAIDLGSLIVTIMVCPATESCSTVLTEY